MAKIIVRIEKLDEDITVPIKVIKTEIPEIIHTSIIKKFGKLLDHKTRVRIAKLLVKPVTWLYVEIMEEL